MDRAISLLSQAALIDNTATLVIETARSLTGDLLAMADGAADAARWGEAEALVERARELAIRYQLSTEPIDAAVRRHAQLERFERVSPTNLTRIGELRGSRVLVLARDGTRHEGRLHEVKGGVLELHMGLDVGRGGTLYHVEPFDLGDVEEIRVYPE